MNAKPFVTAIIAAGGTGSRMGSVLPKQFLDLSGKPVLARTVGVFDASPDIDDIILVIPEGYEDTVRDGIVARRGFGKCREIVAGGGDRLRSVYEGIRRVRPGTEILVVHDGVRPFTTGPEIARVIAGAAKYGACAPGCRPKDTVKLVQADRRAALAEESAVFAESTPGRANIRLIQTPQAFRFDIIKSAYDYAVENGLNASDDAALAEMAGVRTRIIEGNYANIKITTEEDMVFAEAWLLRSR